MAENESLERIIDGCKVGNEQDFEKLIDIYARRCYGYFYRLTGSRDISDDLLSELFVKLVGKIRSFKGGSFEGWLFRTASNVFHDYLRGKQRGRKLLEARKSQVESQTTEAKKSDAEMLDKLQLRLGQLDEDTRELIMLRFYSQLSFKEMAQIRAEPIGTSLAKLHRGLKKLRKLMEQ